LVSEATVFVNKTGGEK